MFDRPAVIWRRMREPLRLFGTVALLWLALDFALYRSGAYFFVAEPDSNTGAVVNALILFERQHRDHARNVLVFGDSRVGEGFSDRIAADGSDLVFINLSVPGSMPRTWYYLLREAIRRGARFEAVLIGTSYRPVMLQSRADWPLDPPHQAPLLGWRDIFDYPAGFGSAEMRERARHAVWMPALAMRRDTLDALAHPIHRLRQLYQHRPGWLAAVGQYVGRDERLPDLVFGADGSVADWNGSDDATRARIEPLLRDLQRQPDPALDAANDAAFAHWLERIALLASEHGARLILYPLPRTPYPQALPDFASPPLLPAAASDLPGTVALAPDLLAELESPAHFFDAVHANRLGRERGSALVGARVRELLGAEAR